VGTLDKGIIYISGGSEQDTVRFHDVLRVALNLKLMVYFWNFLFNTFGPSITETLGNEIVDKG
jgi:hypothetical protein